MSTPIRALRPSAALLAAKPSQQGVEKDAHALAKKRHSPFAQGALIVGPVVFGVLGACVPGRCRVPALLRPPSRRLTAAPHSPQAGLCRVLLKEEGGFAGESETTLDFARVVASFVVTLTLGLFVQFIYLVDPWRSIDETGNVLEVLYALPVPVSKRPLMTRGLPALQTTDPESINTWICCEDVIRMPVWPYVAALRQ